MSATPPNLEPKRIFVDECEMGKNLIFGVGVAVIVVEQTS